MLLLPVTWARESLPGLPEADCPGAYLSSGWRPKGRKKRGGEEADGGRRAAKAWGPVEGGEVGHFG